MKKSLFVLALAAIMVVAFAGSAFAYSPPAGTYAAWDSAGVNSNGPHADYQSGTTKCAVCHSVHNAPVASYVATSGQGGSGGYDWTAGSNTQMLLRSSVAESCRYCHIDTAVGKVQLYGGPTGVYGTAWGVGHTGLNSSACTNCHAVHGAKTYKGDNTGKILRYLASGNRGIQPDVIGGVGANPANLPLFDSTATALAVVGRKYEQQTAFCSECHPNFSRSADATVGRRTYAYDNSNVQNLAKMHSMVATASTAFTATNGGTAVRFDAAGAEVETTITKNSGASAINVAVASQGSGTCRSCHYAGGVDQGTTITYNSFPHYTRGYAYFLANGAAPAGSVVDTIGNTGVGIDPETDGNCLYCHDVSAAGVGVNF